MEQNNLSALPESSGEPTISESFKIAFHEYKENFGFLGFVYLPVAALTILGVFIPGIIGAIFMFASGVLSALVTPGFISAISKKFYPEVTAPYGKLKNLYMDGLRYIVPIVWIGVLTGLCIIFGGMLLVVPGVWLSVVLGYSTYVLIFDGKRGVEALAYSYIYAKDNFWFIVKRTIVLGLGLAIIGGVVSGVFPPEKKLISEISGDKSLVAPAEIKDSKFYKAVFGNEEPYLNVRQPGDYALSAIFNNMFAIPFAMFFAIGIFNFLKSKKGVSITEDEVRKTKNKIKLFAWMGVVLPIVALVVLAMLFGATLISSLRQLLP